jgi:hypothetical protein
MDFLIKFITDTEQSGPITMNIFSTILSLRIN